MLDKLMEQFTKELELEEPLNTEIPGTYAIPLEEDLAIMITPLPEMGFFLKCNVAKCPPQQQEEFYTHMMLGNLFGQGTKGAVLGLDETGNIITLSRAVEGDINYVTFLEIIEDFMNAVDLWRDEAILHIEREK